MAAYAQQPTSDAGYNSANANANTNMNRGKHQSTSSKSRFDWFACRHVDVIEGPSEVDIANQRIAALEDSVRTLRAKNEEQEQMLTLTPEHVQWTWDVFVEDNEPDTSGGGGGGVGGGGGGGDGGKWVPVADHLGHYRHDLDELLTTSYAGRDPLELPSAREVGMVYRADWLDMTMIKTKVEVEIVKGGASEEGGKEEDPWAAAFKAGFAAGPEPSETLKLRRSVVKYKCPATNGLSLGVWSGRPSLIRRGVFFRDIRAGQVDSSNLADNSHFRIACHHFTSGIEREALSADDQVNLDYLSLTDSSRALSSCTSITDRVNQPLTTYLSPPPSATRRPPTVEHTRNTGGLFEQRRHAAAV